MGEGQTERMESPWRGQRGGGGQQQGGQQQRDQGQGQGNRTPEMQRYQSTPGRQRYQTPEMQRGAQRYGTSNRRQQGGGNGNGNGNAQYQTPELHRTRRAGGGTQPEKYDINVDQE